MEYEGLEKLLEFHEKVSVPEDFTWSVMKKIRKINKDRKKTAHFYRGWGVSIIAAAVALLIINISGFNGEAEFSIFLEKSIVWQENINQSITETSSLILEAFNNIIE